MDKLDTLTLFVRIVERGSFSAAAADLGFSRPVATAAIKALEASLGARLLQRTTRHVQPTAEGSLYYQRCVSILAALEEANRSAGGSISGTLRVDVAGNLARTLLLPALPQFLARYPAITLQVGESERDVDLVREGVDCVIRGGHLPDSEMICRPLAMLQEITCASPAYLARYGTPHTIDELAGHVTIGFVFIAHAPYLAAQFYPGWPPDRGQFALSAADFRCRRRRRSGQAGLWPVSGTLVPP